MTARGSAALYTPEVLALAVALAEFPLTGDLTRRAEAASKVCGSRVAIGISQAEDGHIAAIGAKVTACAIGQAAAAIFLQAATGRSHAEVTTALASLEAWLSGGESAPDWPGIAILAPARAYPARHAAILLPWKAAVAALSKPLAAD